MWGDGGRRDAERLATLDGNRREERAALDGVELESGMVPWRMLLMGALGELVEVGIRTGIWLASFTRIFWSVMPWLDHSL